jgi:hypothetical protein
MGKSFSNRQTVVMGWCTNNQLNSLALSTGLSVAPKLTTGRELSLFFPLDRQLRQNKTKKCGQKIDCWNLESKETLL